MRNKLVIFSILVSIVLILVMPQGTAFAETMQEKTVRFGTINGPDTLLYKKAEVLLAEAFKRNGYDFSLECLPGKRSLLWVKKGILDGDALRVPDMNKSGEYPGLVMVEESLITIDQSVWSKLDIKVDGWDSLKDYRIVYQRGTKFIDEKKEIFKSYQIIDNMFSVFKILKKGRADLTITSRDTGAMCLKKLNMENSGIKVLYPPLKEIVLYPYMNAEKHLDLSLRLARTLRAMKEDGTYDRLSRGAE